LTSDTPSLHLIAEDFRGASWSLLLPDGTEAVLIHSLSGVLRGGHYHDCPETSILLSGKVHYWKKLTDGTEIEFDEKPGETLHNEPGEVHLARFDADSWLLDWKVGVKAGEAKTVNVPEFRKLVEMQKH
jgi:hypothetical protein